MGAAAGRPAGVLRRDRDAGWIGGVAAGIARRFGIDASLVRLAFVVAAAAGGIGFAAYGLGWLLIPAGDSRPARVRIRSGRASLEVALGTGLLLVAALLTVRALGIWFSDALVWPLVLIAAGGALIWRQSMGEPSEPRAPGGAPPPRDSRSSPAQESGRATAAAEPPSPVPEPGAGAARAPGGARVAAEEGRRAAIAVSRTGLGIVLVVAAGIVFLQTTGALGAARDVLLAVIAAVVVLAVIFAPWVVRLLRSLTEERTERIRSQERAEVAAHLHDSVLQTLAMVQRRAGDPGEVAALARRQERELRAWLAGRPAPGQSARLAGALEAAAAEVEESHGVPVEVVVVGDRDLDAAHEAVVAAAREAMTNAAKFGAGSPVDVYAESGDSRTQVFVRDRGPGFDTDAVPADRRGVRESIVGRMKRHGGHARVTSAPGAGTEVEIVLEERP
jgi:signal transduction histidine kinase/phage shock protein PspC (stress-responsive transcriptional regulator)